MVLLCNFCATFLTMRTCPVIETNAGDGEELHSDGLQANTGGLALVRRASKDTRRTSHETLVPGAGGMAQAAT